MPPSNADGSPKRQGRGGGLPVTKKAALVAALASGLSIADTAVLHEVSRNTIVNLIDKDQEFHDLLAMAEETAVNAILTEVQNTVRQQVKLLGPKAVNVLEKALRSRDGRVALQAAGIVLRGTGIMDGGKLNVTVGLEQSVGDASSFTD